MGGVLSQFSPEERNAFGAFQNFLQSQEVDPSSIFGQQLADRRFAPARAQFGLGSLINGAGFGGGSFDSFLGNSQATAPGVGGDLFRQIAGNFASGGGAGGSADTLRGLISNAAPGTNEGNMVQALAQQLLGQNIGGFAEQQFGGGLLNEAQQQFARAQASGSDLNFAQVLARALGLDISGG